MVKYCLGCLLLTYKDLKHNEYTRLSTCNWRINIGVYIGIYNWTKQYQRILVNNTNRNKTICTKNKNFQIRFELHSSLKNECHLTKSRQKARFDYITWKRHLRCNLVSLGDYVRHKCSGPGCTPCTDLIPGCEGVPNGPTSYQGRLLTKFYLMCRNNKTESIEICRDGVFDPVLGRCTREVDSRKFDKYNPWNQYISRGLGLKSSRGFRGYEIITSLIFSVRILLNKNIFLVLIFKRTFYHINFIPCRIMLEN